MTRWVARSCQPQASWAEVAPPSQPRRVQQQNLAQLNQLLLVTIRQLLASRRSEAKASQSEEPPSVVTARRRPATIAMELLRRADAQIRPQGLRQLKQQRLGPVLALHWLHVLRRRRKQRRTLLSRTPHRRLRQRMLAMIWLQLISRYCQTQTIKAQLPTQQSTIQVTQPDLSF